ncbi:hypothetical protein LFM09_15850 [Lentzea alba]|uniref:hypothetical protein n=1 Tax=Lentzea alba TaxID=2714351 RepID=UPI0039BF7B12
MTGELDGKGDMHDMHLRALFCAHFVALPPEELLDRAESQGRREALADDASDRFHCQGAPVRRVMAWGPTAMDSRSF